MLTSMEINGYRALRKLSLPGLSQVNLFVGKNNSGKTSILEAAQILASRGSPTVLLRSLRRRAELVATADSEVGEELDVSHLFYGHHLELGSVFSLSGINDSPVRFSCSVVENQPLGKNAQLAFFAEEQSPICLQLSVPNSEPVNLPLSIQGGIADENRRRFIATRGIISPDPQDPRFIRVIPTEGIDVRSMSNLWDKIALTADEPKVIEALQAVEPNLEKLAFLGREGRYPAIYIKFYDSENRLPIGSLGDGVKRLLSLALSVISARNGFVMIDEIDTGLHYTTMQDMWRIIISTAKRLNIQVFATTHSQDCLESLAKLQQLAPELAAEVSVHRIEKGANVAVRYTSDELLIACQHNIELRGN